VQIQSLRNDHDEYICHFNRGCLWKRGSWKEATLPVGLTHCYAVTAEHYTQTQCSALALYAQWLLHVPASFTFKNYTFCPQCLCVLYGCQNRQRLFPCMALTNWCLEFFPKEERNALCGNHVKTPVCLSVCLRASVSK
jgi:hypothetical protein